MALLIAGAFGGYHAAPGPPAPVVVASAPAESGPRPTLPPEPAPKHVCPAPAVAPAPPIGEDDDEPAAPPSYLETGALWRLHAEMTRR